jgi:hypothetical protein
MVNHKRQAVIGVLYNNVPGMDYSRKSQKCEAAVDEKIRIPEASLNPHSKRGHKAAQEPQKQVASECESHVVLCYEIQFVDDQSSGAAGLANYSNKRL